jgi:hypothetical protein
MKLGYSVEGSTDRAILKGLRDRWCPKASLEEGHFRGQTRQSRRREVPAICKELQAKGVNLIVFLCDSNEEEWREVLKAEQARCPHEYNHLTVFGVCRRNAESWLAADPDHIASYFGRARVEFAVDDPKGPVAAAFEISASNKMEDEIAAYVCASPLRRWLTNPSFEDFYEKLRQKSHELKCSLENLLERERDSHHGQAS